jgi:hypothetical protein
MKTPTSVHIERVNFVTKQGLRDFETAEQLGYSEGSKKTKIPRWAEIGHLGMGTNQTKTFLTVRRP